MKGFIFGKSSVGDQIILKLIKDSLKIESEYLGEDVDLSKITPVEENLIIVTNPHLFNVDLDKVIHHIDKDKTKPLIVVRKLKTFGAVCFKPNLEVETILTNKIYVFAGILYVPKEYFKATMAELFREINKKLLRSYILSH